MSLSLAELVSPERSIVLVIDPQNDFCHPDGALGLSGADVSPMDAAIEQSRTLLSEARAAGVPVIFVKIVHDRWSDTPMWMSRKTQRDGKDPCRAGTWGAEFYKIAPGPDDYTIVKRRYSAFIGTELENVLRATGRDVLIFAGMATSVCVESTARDACMRDFGVVVLNDCTADYDPDAHYWSLRNISTAFGWVASAQEVAAVWGESTNTD